SRSGSAETADIVARSPCNLAGQRPGTIMILGLSGSLLSHDGLNGALEALRQGLPPVDRGWFRKWQRDVRSEMGPACSARHVFDKVAAPLASQLGFRIVSTHKTTVSSTAFHALLQADDAIAMSLLVTAWGHDAGTEWRAGVRAGIAHGV